MDIANIRIDNTIEDQVSIKWTVVDGEWTYMDTYVYSKDDYTSLTPEQLLERQTAQYLKWRNYCENPQG
jgi:hypothetical protein